MTHDHGYVPLVISTSLPFPHSWLITRFLTRLTRWVPLVEQELLTLPEHLTSPPVFSGVRVTRSLDLSVCFVDRCLSVCTFSFLFVLLRFTDSDYPFGILKLFLNISTFKNIKGFTRSCKMRKERQQVKRTKTPVWSLPHISRGTSRQEEEHSW